MSSNTQLAKEDKTSSSGKSVFEHSLKDAPSSKKEAKKRADNRIRAKLIRRRKKKEEEDMRQKLIQLLMENNELNIKLQVQQKELSLLRAQEEVQKVSRNDIHALCF